MLQSPALGSVEGVVDADVEWVPLSELGLTNDAVDGVGDLFQGICPDCFFVATLKAIARSPDTIRRMVTADPSKENVYSVRFRAPTKGEWVDIEVDGLIPCSAATRSPLFVRSTDGKWWPHIVEKAYAQYYGSYGAISGGNVAEAMHDLTGCPVLDVEVSSSSTSWWKELGARLRGGCAAVAGTIKAPAKGLAPGHAYMVDTVVPLPDSSPDGGCVFRMINPLGGRGGRWEGTWSPTSPSWKKLSPTTTKQLLGGSTAVALAGEGIFFISISDFVKNFQSLCVCVLEAAPHSPTTTTAGDGDDGNNSSFVSKTFSGVFPASDGGCTNYTTFRNNAAYLLQVPRNVFTPKSPTLDLYIVLSQSDRRRESREHGESIKYPQIGISVCNDSTEQQHPQLPPSLTCDAMSVIHKSTFWNRRVVGTHLQIKPKKTAAADVCYCVVPSTYHAAEAPGQEYDVTFFWRKPDKDDENSGGVVSVSPAPDASPLCRVVLDGRWSKSSGGSANIRASARYAIKATSQCDIRCYLRQHPSSSEPSTRTTPRRSSSQSRTSSVPRRSSSSTKKPSTQLVGGNTVGAYYLKLHVFRTADLSTPELYPDVKPINYAEISCGVSVTEPEGAMLFVVPCTGHAGECGAYTIEFLATAPIEVERLDAVGGATAKPLALGGNGGSTTAKKKPAAPTMKASQQALCGLGNMYAAL
eukprot:PhM_4_TR7618/c0_g1_i1/m.4848